MFSVGRRSVNEQARSKKPFFCLRNHYVAGSDIYETRRARVLWRVQIASNGDSDGPTTRGLKKKEGRQNVAPLCILRSTGVHSDSGARIRCALVE